MKIAPLGEVKAKFQAMLDAAEERIRATGGMSHAEVWKEIEDTAG
jgi:hypothetical protein